MNVFKMMVKSYSPNEWHNQNDGEKLNDAELSITKGVDM